MATSNCHFFIEQGALVQTQQESQKFGPVSDSVFRLTSKFSLSAPKKAFSICKGIVLVQPQSGTGNENKVNLILRPYTQPFPGLNVKYFIYRGLQKSDFFDASNVIILSGSDFIVKINADFNAFYDNSPKDSNGNPIVTKPSFTAGFIGYNANDAEDKLLSDYFFKESTGAGTDETSAFELPMIDIGKSLGNFATGECGIDVVLNYGDYKHDFDNGEFIFDLAYARKPEALLTVSGNDYPAKVKREQITQFIDIASFYGLFVKEGKVTIDTAGTKTDLAGNAIYDQVLQSFATKNNWYLYLQSDRGRSYNFYNNYNISTTSQNDCKLGNQENVISESKYGTNGWPLLINTQTQSPVATNNNLFLQLVTDNNTNTSLYGAIGTVENAQQNNFCNADNLRLPPDTDGNFSRFTKVLHLSTPAFTDGKNIASISLLLYQGVAYQYEAGTALDENGNPIAVMAQPNFFDDVFSLIKAQPLLQSNDNSEFSKMTDEKLNLINEYFDKRQQGLSAAQTLVVNDVIETGIEATPTLARVTYITETADVLNNAVSPTGSVTPDTKTSTSASGTVAQSKTYNLPEPYYYNLKLFTDSTQTITGLELKILDGSVPNKIILGLTQTENDIIKALITTELKNPRLFLVDLFDDNNLLLSPENIGYQKYKVGIVAEDNIGVLKLYLPATDVMVYSLDRKYHFSKGYSEYMQVVFDVVEGDNLIEQQIQI